MGLHNIASVLLLVLLIVEVFVPSLHHSSLLAYADEDKNTRYNTYDQLSHALRATARSQEYCSANLLPSVSYFVETAKKLNIHSDPKVRLRAVNLLGLLEQRRDTLAESGLKKEVLAYPRNFVIVASYAMSLINLSRVKAKEALQIAIDVGTWAVKKTRERTIRLQEDKHSELDYLFQSAINVDEIESNEKLLAHLYSLKGRMELDRGDWEAGQIALQKSVSLCPDIPQVHEWLARSADHLGNPRAFIDEWKLAIKSDPLLTDRNVWPVYCYSMQLGHPATPKPLLIDEGNLIQKLETLGDQDFPQARFGTMYAWIKQLRARECSDEFVIFRNTAIRKEIEFATGYGPDDSKCPISKNKVAQHYSWSNYAYGQVYYQRIYKLLKRPTVIEVMRMASLAGLSIVNMGSNIGVESMFFALTYPDVNVHGYELLCDFVDIANGFKSKYNMSNLQFTCGDALKADISNAAMVFIDNQAWDVPLVNRLWKKLDKELPLGSIVIDYASADQYVGIAPSNQFKLSTCENLEVSWNPIYGTQVSVSKKHGKAFSGEYRDFNGLQNHIRGLLKITQNMMVEIQSRQDYIHSCQKIQMPSLEQLDSLSQLTATEPSLFTTTKFAKKIVEAFQRTLFHWHNVKFWVHQGQNSSKLGNSISIIDQLLPEEISYLNKYFSITGQEFLNFGFFGNWTGNRMSSYTYSHRSKDGTIDSLRFRVGTTSQPQELLFDAIRVLKARGIDLPKNILQNRSLDTAPSESKGLQFYGLGWDLRKSQFKVYYMMDSFAAIPLEYQNLLPDFVRSKHRKLLRYSLLSYTYDGARNNSLHEVKIYVYPKTIEDAISIGIVPGDKPPNKYVSTVAIMFSDKRGKVAQYDTDDIWSCIWHGEMSKSGQKILDSYMDVGMNLETFTYESRNTFTLYFPAGSG